MSTACSTALIWGHAHLQLAKVCSCKSAVCWTALVHANLGLAGVSVLIWCMHTCDLLDCAYSEHMQAYNWLKCACLVNTQACNLLNCACLVNTQLAGAC
eukprot:1158379-Pelagomonas_calceolata.AAC.2